MNKIKFALAIIFVSINLTSSLLFETNGKRFQYCFTKEIYSGDEVQVSYIISGESEDKVNCSLTGNEGQVIYEQQDSESGEFKETAKNSGTYKLCFYPLNSNRYYITFEFFTNMERGHTLDMAKDENLHEMKKELGHITLMFEEIEKNVKFLMDRRNKHTEVISDISTSIRNISYFKIFVIILVSLLQVFLIHKFFSGSTKTSSYRNNMGSIFDLPGERL